MSDTERDEKLRRSLLTSAKFIGDRREGRWVGGAGLADSAKDDSGVGVVDDKHAASLLADLVNCGVFEEEAGVHVGAQATQLRHRRFRFTKKGWELWMESIPPVPGIWDPRLGDR